MFLKSVGAITEKPAGIIEVIFLVVVLVDFKGSVMPP